MTKAKRGLGEVGLPVTTQAVGRTSELRRLMGGKAGKAGSAGEAGDAGPPRRKKLTVMVPAELLKRLQDASYWSREAVVDIVARAIERELLRVEAKHGAEPAPAALRPGRKARPS